MHTGLVVPILQAGDVHPHPHQLCAALMTEMCQARDAILEPQEQAINQPALGESIRIDPNVRIRLDLVDNLGAAAGDRTVPRAAI